MRAESFAFREAKKASVMIVSLESGVICQSSDVSELVPEQKDGLNII
jgi:hypothetical protein